MKLQHSINKLSKVSFTSRPHVDMMGLPVNKPNGEPQMDDAWEEVSNVVAKGFEELQDRIIALETKVEEVLGGDKIVDLLEKLAKMKDTSDKPPKELPKPGVPLSRIKGKGGRPKKDAVSP